MIDLTGSNASDADDEIEFLAVPPAIFQPVPPREVLGPEVINAVCNLVRGFATETEVEFLRVDLTQGQSGISHLLGRISRALELLRSERR